MIGTCLFALSCFLISVGSFYSKKRTAESGTKPEFYDSNRACFPFRLQYEAKIEGELSVTLGEVDFSLEDFFGWVPYTTYSWLSSSYVVWKGQHARRRFERKLKAGDYIFQFSKKSKDVEVKAELSYKVTYYIHSLKRLVDLGLAFVEVSVPLLVTGLVV
jgi:hypothetical protein